MSETTPKSYAEAADGGTDVGLTPKDRFEQLQAEHKSRVNGHTPSAKTNGETSPQPTDTISEPAKPTHKRQSSGRSNKVNAAIANLYGDGVLEKEFEDSKGRYLTSTKMPRSYRNSLKVDETEKKATSPAPEEQLTRMDSTQREQLVSGRRAGAGWQRSKIRWAPLNVPLQRRLQTLAVLWHGLSIVALLALFLFLCAIPILWPILVPYLLYCLLSQASTSGELSHRSERLRRSSIWSLFASYFPARLHRSQELPATRKYIFGYHPHGIISNGAYAAFATEALGFSQLFPGITNTLLTLDSNFRIPLYRDYMLAMGLASVSRESCENLLSKGGPNREGMGRAITIVVGGARESLDATPHTMKLVLKRRKGFVKLAIRNGADLVPVFGFGENDIFEQFHAEEHPYVHKFQLLVKRFMGFTIPLFHARGVFNYDVGLLPYRRPLNVVVGRPIQVEMKQNPTEAEVDALHGQYVAELERLWNEWKDEFAKERISELEIVE